YRAKLQGRNRVLDASSEPLLVPEKRSAPLVAVPDDGDHMMPLPTAGEVHHDADRRHPRPHAVHGPRFLSLSKSLAAVVGLVSIGLLAGLAYFAVNMGLISLAVAVEGHERWRRAFQERFAWLAPHYVVYGFIGSVIFIGYNAVHLVAFAVFALPLLLMRKTQEAYLRHTQRSAQKLREAAETIQTQNVSLEQANRLLRERSTAAMES